MDATGKIKLYIEGSDEVLAGTEALKDELGITLTAEKTEVELNLFVRKSDEEMLSATFKTEPMTGNVTGSVTGEVTGEVTGNVTGKATGEIVYGKGKVRFFRALSLVCEAFSAGKKEFSVSERPLFTTNGAMFDMSRNAVMRPETVKYLLRKMALLGMNTFMLYTEDTYEVRERPYFGYMRGRYTVSEIKEIDAYAVSLGIELIPCIQMLGHLATYLRWHESDAYRDTVNALLPGAEETYRFINDLLATVSEAFTSRRLHIGMDETHDLGTGAALDKYGYRPRKELYFEHLARVSEMARKYGFRPMMWSDMFFRLSAEGMEGFCDYDMRTVLLPGIDKLLPEGVQPVFWDYYHDNKEFYTSALTKHKVFGNDTIFAGGVWAWSGHAVQLRRSVRNSIPALEACRECGTREVIATVWHNGSEACEPMALAGLALYSEFDYKGRHDVDDVRAAVKRVLDTNYDDFLTVERVEYPHGDDSVGGVTRAFLYNDPLCGLVDKHVEMMKAGEYYRALTPVLEKLVSDKKELAPGFEVCAALSSLLENKSDFGVRSKAAYDAGDKSALAALAEECDVIIAKVRRLRELHRSEWMGKNKPQGWEVHDIRYGGIVARFETAKERLGDYVAGRTDRIEELEEVRLRIDGAPESAPAVTGGFLWTKFSTYATANIL